MRLGTSIVGSVCGIAMMASIAAAQAAPANVGGPNALALASVVAFHSSTLGSYGRRIMARLFAGNSSISFPPNMTLSVKADSITCQSSNVDIVARNCEITFGTGKRSFTGREANELFATLATAGVAAEGAAGSMIESVSDLVCTIDPNEIKKKAGGGAMCEFTSGQ